MYQSAVVNLLMFTPVMPSMLIYIRSRYIQLKKFFFYLGSTCTSTLLPVTQCPQVMETGSPVGAVVGACVGTALLYTMILLVSICALICWNKKHR